mmetsp:Transcript_116587/g.293248  ORF Transcript_116587/g.293248 Transcript_116587/m.293248 type:complete len:151 (+) Transcript_116587:399-851(+)
MGLGPLHGSAEKKADSSKQGEKKNTQKGRHDNVRRHADGLCLHALCYCHRCAAQGGIPIQLPCKPKQVPLLHQAMAQSFEHSRNPLSFTGEAVPGSVTSTPPAESGSARSVPMLTTEIVAVPCGVRTESQEPTDGFRAKSGTFCVGGLSG